MSAEYGPSLIGLKCKKESSVHQNQSFNRRETGNETEVEDVLELTVESDEKITNSPEKSSSQAKRSRVEVNIKGKRARKLKSAVVVANKKSNVPRNIHAKAEFLARWKNIIPNNHFNPFRRANNSNCIEKTAAECTFNDSQSSNPTKITRTVTQSIESESSITKRHNFARELKIKIRNDYERPITFVERHIVNNFENSNSECERPTTFVERHIGDNFENPKFNQPNPFVKRQIVENHTNLHSKQPNTEIERNSVVSLEKSSFDRSKKHLKGRIEVTTKCLNPIPPNTNAGVDDTETSNRGESEHATRIITLHNKNVPPGVHLAIAVDRSKYLSKNALKKIARKIASQI